MFSVLHCLTLCCHMYILVLYALCYHINVHVYTCTVNKTTQLQHTESMCQLQKCHRVSAIGVYHASACSLCDHRDWTYKPECLSTCVQRCGALPSTLALHL